MAGNVEQLTIDRGWTEPESAANTDYQPKYPYNNVTQTESGHTFEMDDTPTRERIRLNHRSGTFIEMHPNGDEVHKVYGNGYEITIKNKNVSIKGHCTVSIDGDCSMEVGGDYNLHVKKDFTALVEGEYNVRSRKDLSISSDEDVSIAANENFGGTLRFAAADHLFLASDLVVGGSIAADVITAESRIATGKLGGVTAGLAGFVSLTGGLSLGIPVAVPLSVTAVGSGTFGVKIFAPYASSVINSSILEFDVVNFLLDKLHIHPTPKGPSGPRIPPPTSC